MIVVSIFVIVVFSGRPLDVIAEKSASLLSDNVLPVGEMIFIKPPDSTQSLRLAGKPMSRLQGRPIYFGSLGLQSAGQLVGLVQQPSHSSRWVWLTQTLRADRSNKVRKINLAPQAKKRLRNTKEKRHNEEIYFENLLQRTDGQLSLECWQLPVAPVVTSKFASKRHLSSGYTYDHTGVDLRAAVGDEIRASSKGQVEFADHMVVPGNSVLVYHGSGVYTRYAHLSKITVERGQRIEKGQIIGKAGDTGRVTAAHLHWEVLWKGRFVDPLRFVQRWEQFCGPT